MVSTFIISLRRRSAAAAEVILKNDLGETYSDLNAAWRSEKELIKTVLNGDR